MHRLVLLSVFAGVILWFGAASAGADPGANNPVAQYRTFSCTNGKSYSAVFAGPSASFLLTDRTSVFAIKVFTEILPSGDAKTFNYGIGGFDASSLLTCSYTDPEGVFNVFQGFLTPPS